MADETQNTQATQEQGGAQTAGGDPTTSTPESAQAAKTFTQDEVNDLIKARLERERKGQPTKDELAAFRAWQDSQKTAEQKTADEINAAKQAQTAAEQRAELLAAQVAAMKKGVSAEAVEDVIALAQGRTSDTVTLDKAIDEVLKKYPQFAGTSAPRTTGVPAGSGGAAVSGVEAAFRAKNPNIKI